MSDNNETIIGESVVTDESIEEFIGTSRKGPSYHTILEVWKATLEPSRNQGEEKINPAWATTMVQSYAGLTYKDLIKYQTAFYSKVHDLLDILDAEIAQDENCLVYTTPEEDAAENRTHYLNLLLLWQQQILQYELDWDCTDEDAAVEVAAMSEVHKMFFGELGLTQFLDNIKLEITEADQAVWSEALTEQRDGSE